MNIIIKKEIEYSDEVFNFLLDQSFELFVEIYNVDSTNLIAMKNMKDGLANAYKNDMENGKIYTAHDSDDLVGVAVIDNFNYFSDLFIKKEYRDRGIGSVLLEKVVEDNSQNGEIVINANPKYLDFFKKHFFEIESVEEKSIKMRRKK